MEKRLEEIEKIGRLWRKTAAPTIIDLTKIGMCTIAKYDNHRGIQYVTPSAACFDPGRDHMDGIRGVASQRK